MIDLNKLVDVDLVESDGELRRGVTYPTRHS